MELETALYSQPDIERVTGLPGPTLEAWVQRQLINIAEPHPGPGRPRLYSKRDVVKLAIMRRVANLGIGLQGARDMAEMIAETLRQKGKIRWAAALVIHSGPGPMIAQVKGGLPELAAISKEMQGDAAHVVSYAVFERLLLADHSSAPEDPEERFEWLARRGVHPEAVVIFPVGGIVNGVLAQLRQIDEDIKGSQRADKSKTFVWAAEDAEPARP
jgi:hypothetical protein